MPTNVSLTGLAKDLDIRAAPESRGAGAIPCGLLTGAKVTAPIKKGDLITRANAAVPANSKIAILRARQDAMLGL